MKKTLTFALALTLLAGTGSAFAQNDNHNGNDNRDRNTPPVTTQQRPDDRNMGDRNNSQQRFDNRDRTNGPVAQHQDNFGRDNAPVATRQGFDNHDRNANPAMSMRGPGMDRQGHPDWRQGGHIARNDWGRGQHVDYRAHHLRTPPRGYEWRQVDGNFVLAAAATGLIASIILNAH